MSKKAQPDPKTRTIQHINGTKQDSKNMVNARSKEAVDVRWEKDPTWTVYNYTESTTNDKMNYKLFTEEGNKGNDDYDTE
jgi:hypothetical protein